MKISMRAALFLATSLAAAVTAVPAAAASFQLFNTGTDAANVKVSGGNGVVDPHYLIVATTDPSALVGQQAVTYNYPYPILETSARWIATTATGGGGGVTTFRQTFDLTGYDPMTASILGQSAADNLLKVFLNGQLAVSDAATGSYNALTSWSIASGFVSGINTLDFVLTDLGPPGAFIVTDLTGSADLGNPAGPVPESATWMMMIAGFGTAGLVLRRRTREAIRISMA